MSELWSTICSIPSLSINAVWGIPKLLAGSTEVTERVIIQETISGGSISRLAGWSGALAVSLGSYGAYVLKDVSVDPERKYVFDTGYRMHILHSVALLGVPLTAHPTVVCSLMGTGMVLFCGSCYFMAFTGQTKWRWITPMGGCTLIMAWLAMIV